MVACRVSCFGTMNESMCVKFESFEPIRAASHEISWLRPAIAHRTECAICYCDEIEGLRPAPLGDASGAPARNLARRSERRRGGGPVGTHIERPKEALT